MAVSEQHELDARLLLEKEHYNCLKETAENLENFVTSAHKGGVLTSNEAESVLRPLRKVVRKCNSYIKNAHLGFISKPAPAKQREEKDEEEAPSSELQVSDRSTLVGARGGGQTGQRDEKTQSSDFDAPVGRSALKKNGPAKTVQFDERALVEDDVPTIKAEQQNRSAADDCEVDVIRVIDA
mmetsp:Transcript_115698/g.199842  ORF Transcript_115698/g.199842 Transcript_115698/m.199842 type:complete len:182 (+) Transcript_115698:3-548(+)